jgi:hypothetical protein
MALCGLVTVLYAILCYLVWDAEMAAGIETDQTYVAYGMLAALYLIGTVLLGLVDRRPLWAVRAAIQLIVIALFVVIGAGVLQRSEGGVFGYEALDGLHIELWAAAITGLQVVLLGLMSHLAASRPVTRAVTPE